ncbi:unnamed protein product [Trichobilharzia regenti]|nr:unnamed protein product [Trichobilharzia regenti]
MSSGLKEKKTYAVLRKAGSKEFFIAAKNCMSSDDMCLYHSSVTDSEVEACMRPRPEWLLIDCQMLAELEAKSTLLTAKRIHSILSNSDDLGDTLPLTNSKRQSTSSPQMPVATSSPILQPVQQTAQPAWPSWEPRTIDNSQLEFSLATKEEFSQLEASLKNPKFKHSFVSLQLTFHRVQMTKLAGNLSFNPQSSLRQMLNYVMEPKRSSRFLAFGTPKKLVITKYNFYKVTTCKLALFKYFLQSSLSDSSMDISDDGEQQ